KPPATASRSPVRARADSVKSTPVMTTTPHTAKNVPVTTVMLIDCPVSQSITTTHTTWLETKAVAAATDVSLSAVTHVAKCPASMTPAITHPAQVRADGRRRLAAANDVTANGAETSAAPALRHIAIASGAAGVAAISGPEALTPSTATNANSAFTARS